MTREEILNAEVLYYCQPVYDCQTKSITKGELLLRARGPGGGFYPTQAFIAAAEAHGLIPLLDIRALRHACGALRAYRGAGVTQLSVNISPLSCRDVAFADMAQALLQDYRDVCGLLILELTETQPGEQDAQVKETLRRLQSCGASFAIDDFGKDYAGIARMLDTPFDYLKLDKTIVDRCEGDALARVVTEKLVDAMRLSHKHVVAEGIETHAQARRMQRMGVRYLQGYYCSPPLPEREFIRRVCGRKAAKIAEAVQKGE